MAHVEKILAACIQGQSEGTHLALVTVVEAEGSAYRRQGAQMLVFPSGRRVGMISGGCMEADIVGHARQVMNHGNPMFVRYGVDRDNGDLIIESGCNGAVGILIERATDPDASMGLVMAADASRRRDYGSMAMVYHVERSSTVRVGERVALLNSVAVTGDPHILSSIPSLYNNMCVVSERGKARSFTYELPDGAAAILITPVVPPPAILICGAGDDAIPLAAIASMAGMEVTIADDRSPLLTADRFPVARRLLYSGLDGLDSVVTFDSRTAAVVMSHSYTRDIQWMRLLLPRHIGYLGMLGPRKRSQKILGQLLADGVRTNEAQRDKLYAPTGLDIGSETPEEISLAIVAEIHAAMNGRSGGFLRDAAGSMHEHVPHDGFRQTPLREIKAMRCPVLA